MQERTRGPKLDNDLEKLLLRANELLSKRRGGMGNKREVGATEHGPTKRRWGGQEAEVVEKQQKHRKKRGVPSNGIKEGRQKTRVEGHSSVVAGPVGYEMA
ncbi:hypothetical protein NDU88_008619 [Pleurodeles waltl]|uniref:Uncharacterized protein n=1 Tax=Pleurodeles waltl TaxID=8319 RepID=A0AAV7QS98_PLEWA|nr:hypothetical protein NDU88_008619 [Pleurodeles waltl]